MNYQKQALDFAKKHGITLTINSWDYKKHFQDDTQERYVFNCTLKCNGKRYTFNFGQSIQAGGEEPTMYDVLTCLEKYEVGSFDNFCSNYGYDNDSIKALKTYQAVAREYKNMLRVFGETILEEMQEIQ
jgi:hypothetical protein